MRFNTLIVVLFTVLFFSGCGKKLDLTPNEIQTNVKKLDPDEMKLIYRTIQNEINFQNKKADTALLYGYNHDAITAYELVNYYKGYYYISAKKISNLKQLTKRNTNNHYKQALKYLNKSNKKALLELNTVLKNNPKHEDAIKHLSKLEDKRKIKIFLNSLDSSTKMAIRNNKSSFKSIKKINNYQKELISYDYDNQLIYEAQDILESEYDNLMNKAIKNYKKEKLLVAKTEFNEIISIYTNDKSAKKYLFKTNSKLNLKNAQVALKKGNCAKSINLSNKVLKSDYFNKKAKIILSKAETECRKQISKILQRGKVHYNNKNLDIAQKSFQKVLKLDPNNSISLVYTKKIQSQLRTIKSLN